MKKLFILCMACLMLLLASCGNTDDPIGPPGDIIPDEPERFFSSDNLFEFEVTEENNVSVYYYYGEKGGYDIVIPSMITYNGVTYSVTSLSDNAFINKSVHGVVIPRSITSIGTNCFDSLEDPMPLTIYYPGTYEEFQAIDMDQEMQFWVSYATYVYDYR